LTFHLFGALADFERDIIREATMAGLQAARARGRIGGRPKVMVDHKINITRHLMKDSARVYFFFCLSKNTASRNCFSFRLFCHNRCRLTDSYSLLFRQIINLLVSTGPNSLFNILIAVSISISSSVYFILFISDFPYHKKKVDFLSKYSIQAVYIV
jgi:hypothetical protein